MSIAEDCLILERAAKAAGYVLTNYCTKSVICYYGSWGGPWNPLDNDGDALRLAVQLRMHVLIYSDESAAITSSGTASEPGIDATAVRRAIVRAAASGETK